MTKVDFEHLDLDAIRAEADAKYLNLMVEGVCFRSVIRMSKDERAEFSERVSARGEDDVDIVDFYRCILTLAASDKPAAAALLDRIGDDAAVLDTLVTLYFERTQAGEASPSQN